LIPDWSRLLEELREDRVSGALALTVKAIDLARAAEPTERDSIARSLLEMHRAIVTVANVGRLLLRGAVDIELAELRQSLLDGNRLIAEHAAKIIPAGTVVLTLSDSSTVEAALQAIRPQRVLALESLPGGEGTAFAQRIGATVVPDAMMSRVVPQAGCALVGIDAFDSSGAILHKTGTLPLALCCRHFGRPFYAAGHSFKLSPIDTAVLLDQAAPDAPFDHTPGDLITSIVTERGPRKP